MITDKQMKDGMRKLTEAIAGMSDEDLTALGTHAVESTTGKKASSHEIAQYAERLRRMPHDGGDQARQMVNIEQRSVTDLLLGMKAKRLPDGTTQMSLPGEKALVPFSARSFWKIKDVATMRQRMIEFYESPFGLLSGWEILGRSEVDDLRMTPEAGAHLYTGQLREVWMNPDLMLMAADDAFLDMMQAAAVSAPTGQLEAGELLSDSGVIFFQKERIITQFSATFPIRGILWYLDEGLINMQALMDGHYERDTPGPEKFEPPVENYAYLYVRNLLRTSVTHPELAGEPGVEALGILRSIAAITRSAHTRSENKKIELREKKNGRVCNIQQETIRVLSLSNPDFGRFELDAATGRKQRQHWVRGHWRNQWYRTENVNRRIWIDGFVKGDASVGIVTGQKVYRATAPSPE